MIKVAIFVEGGVVQDVESSQPVDWEVFDVDDLKEEHTRGEIDQMWDKLTTFEDVEPSVEAYIRYPKEDWKYEVANDDTTLGYREWVENQIEANSR